MNELNKKTSHGRQSYTRIPNIDVLRSYRISEISIDYDDLIHFQL